MGNQALCQHDRTESMLKAEYQIRQRKVTQVNEAVKLDLEQEHKQSLIPTIYQNEQQQTSCLHDWLESLHESVLITQINLNCDASTKFLSEIDEEEEIDQTKQSLIDTQEIFEYKKSYPYCNSNLDMNQINNGASQITYQMVLLVIDGLYSQIPYIIRWTIFCRIRLEICQSNKKRYTQNCNIQ
ncbi:unnamed protein product [Paramecium pentaurelia]|uniref:Uncharacterized protein n=1 Tax=Paramecium pentaurelia TaxID=43138 RepID=A0A8S1T1C2_9CILI|nr:unnamed protein product [Paramecium pentaurelia]